MSELSHGDSVILVNDQDGHGKGLTGTLLKSCFHGGVPSDIDWMIYLDEKQSWGHTGDGTIPIGHGWFVLRENLELQIQTKPYDPTQGNEEDDI